MITCRKATLLHTAADEGELEGVTRALYAFHMTVCAPCRRYRQQLRATAGVLQRMPKQEPPESLLERLAEELDPKD